MIHIKGKNVIRITFTWLIVAVVTFGFLSLCNWNLHLGEWNGFSRFIIGAEGVIYVINLLSEM